MENLPRAIASLVSDHLTHAAFLLIALVRKHPTAASLQDACVEIATETPVSAISAGLVVALAVQLLWKAAVRSGLLEVMIDADLADDGIDDAFASAVSSTSGLPGLRGRPRRRRRPCREARQPP